MLKNIKLTVKHTFFYALGNIAPKLSGFILLPIYTKSISVADYGVLGLLEVIEVFTAQLLGMGLGQAQLRWLGLATSTDQKKSYLFTILAFIFVLSISNLAFVFFFKEILSTIIFSDGNHGNYLLIIALTVSLTILNKIPLTLLRSEQKSNLYALAIILQFTINLACNIYFLIYQKLGLIGILYSQSISVGLTLVLLLPYLLARIKPKFNSIELKTMLKFGYPIALSSISAIILNLGDRYILTQLSTLQQVGLYSLAYKISNVVKVFVVDAFLLTLPTVAWKIIKEDDYPQRFLSKTMTYYTLILLWIGLAVAAFHKGILHQFALNKLYWDAEQVVPYLIVGIIIYGMTGFLYFVLQIPMKTKKVAQIIALVAILNIILNLSFVPKLAMLGAALATIISQLTAFILAFRASQNAYFVKYEVGRLLLLFGVVIALYFLTTIFNSFELAQRILYKGLLVLSFPLLLYFLNFYTNVETSRIKGSIKKWSGKLLYNK